MSATNSSRLKLRLESDDELVDQFATNWPILDKFAGGLLVAPGTTPPDSELYDGCLVREGANGKSWLAVRNPLSGTYSKSWLTYPWQCAAYANVLVGSSQPDGFVVYGLSTVDPLRCTNADSSALVGGQLIPPIPGIYQAQLHTRWSYADGADGIYKSGAISLNGNVGVRAWNCDIRRKNNNVVTNFCAQIFTFSPSEAPYPVGVLLAQNSGGNRDVDIDLTLTLLSPK